MERLIIDDMELRLENYNRDYIKSEVTEKNLIRIKCESIVKGHDNERLKKILENKSFEVNIPDDNLKFKGRKGEITYYYTDGNPFTDKEIEYTHVIEIIEFEDVKEDESNNKLSLEQEILILKNKLSFIENLLIKKNIISIDDIDRV
ncbi:hypothetical protein SAMN05660462_02401 [Proteiniborus ethanoligenes]|uniref:Uncharacterized protein n=1 Tax=Proteiniborus ethanoligenes TaxID=415015 RepID=A0A1H3RK73_9FIRM|nr:hypothetical protein [Proteiniborus ethanoligenes]SDZ25765.1 hypothetical protein SAMN05660462_02401 [Proteiniborus ethanoligenes]